MAPTVEAVDAITATETVDEPIEISALVAEHNSHGEIAALAYEFWMQRGCPIGSPEEDWFRAEEQIRNNKANVATPVGA